jgi:AmmeMemoRadiSam system protein B
VPGLGTIIAIRLSKRYNGCMKKTTFFFLLGWALVCLGQEVRPVRDDVGFCWQRPQMRRLMDLLARTGQRDFPVRGLVAGISPHDDYLYAGTVYYPLFKNLRTKEAVIFGVTHGTVRKEIGDPHDILLLDDFHSWPGLSGETGISPLRDWLKNRLQKEDYVVSNQAHALEHSIEALVPFLQYNNPGIKITPVMVTAMPFEKMDRLSERLAEALAGYIRENKLQLGRDIFFLISADANHYGHDFDNIPYGEDEKAHEQGTKRDSHIARALVNGTLDSQKIVKLTQELWGASYLDYRDTYWCGKYDIPFGLLTIAKTVKKITGRNLKGNLLRYSDTYSEGVLPLKKAGFGITAPYSLKHWVGFFSAGFYLD